MKKTIRKPMLLLLCAVIALSACLCGCDNKEPNFPVALSDTTRSALELCTNPYKDGELDKIYESLSDDSTAKQLNDEYEIQCLRKNDDGYTVIYEGKKRVLVLYFDSEGNWQKADRLHSIYRITDTRGKFDKLQKGDSVTKVQTADPTCYFPFLVDPDSTDLETNHYSGDGYHTHILYDADHNVSSVSYEMM